MKQAMERTICITFFNGRWKEADEFPPPTDRPITAQFNGHPIEAYFKGGRWLTKYGDQFEMVRWQEWTWEEYEEWERNRKRQ